MWSEREQVTTGPDRRLAANARLGFTGAEMTVDGKGDQIQSVQRALEILELVGTDANGISARQLSDRMQLSLPAVYHTLRTLIEGGFVVHHRGQQRYVLGHKINTLNRRLEAQLSLPLGVQGVVHQIHQEVASTACLVLYQGSNIVVAHVEGSVGHRRAWLTNKPIHDAAHATAFGKVMLAAMTPDSLESYLVSAGIARFTNATIVDPCRLKDELATVAAVGLASELEEFQRGLASMAVPVRDPAGRTIGAVAVSIAASQFPPLQRTCERALRRGADQVARRIGARKLSRARDVACA